MNKALIPERNTFIGCHKFFKHKSEAIKKTYTWFQSQAIE